ncbi:MAG: hypothetical protein GTO03_00895 [Planctomycetales bacterium]|nr:hypothetical protein [Planctomycetales bacterium]
MADPLAKLFVIATACGVGGAMLGLFASLVSRGQPRIRTELAVGIGFLVGVSLGALFGIFAIMADRV